jgi:outer membrane protein TolC
MNKKISLIFIYWIAINNIWAQDSIYIKVEEAYSSALLNNKEIQLLKTETDIAKSQYRQTDQIFLPQISASYNVLTTNNPLYAFGFKLQQESITPADFNPALLNNPDQTTNFQTVVEIKQPLFNADAFYLRKAANNYLEMYNHKTERNIEYLTMQIQMTYAKLQLLNQSVHAWKSAIIYSSDAVISIQRKYDQGYITKAELLNAQVQNQSMINSLKETESEYQNTCDQFSILIGKTIGVIYKVDPFTISNTTNINTNIDISQRKDILAMTKGIESYKYKANSSLFKAVPRINAFGNYYLNDKEAFGFSSNSYFAGISMQWDLFKGNSNRFEYKSNKLEKIKLEQHVTIEKEKSLIELEKTNRQIKDLNERITQADLSISQSKEVYTLTLDRYNQGLVSTNELLRSESQLAQQQLNKLQIIYGLSVAQSYSNFLNPIK